MQLSPWENFQPFTGRVQAVEHSTEAPFLVEREMLEFHRPGFKTTFHHLLTVWTRARYLVLCASFFSCIL